MSDGEPRGGPARLSWWELHVADVEAAKAFVSAVLGWEPSTAPGYDESWWFVPRPGQLVGLIEAATDRSTDAVAHHRTSTLGSLLYFDVDDMEATLAAVEPAGGTVEHGRQEIGDQGDGWSAVVREPGGTRIGLITDNPPPP